MEYNTFMGKKKAVSAYASAERRTVRAGGRVIEFEFVRGGVRNLNVRIRADGSVRVSAPFDMPFAEVERFVAEKAGWIAAHSAERKAGGGYSYAAAGSVPVLGEKRPLRVEKTKEGTRAYVRESGDGSLTVYAPDAEAADRAVSAWLLRLAGKKLPEIFRRAEDSLRGEFGEPVELGVRYMRSRWGSCTAAKREIRLNAALVTAPPECVEYVCLHELAHLKARGHGKDFYRVLGRICPDHRELKKRLNACALGRLT